MLLRNILLKLTATAKIAVAVLIVAIALIWYDVLNRLLAFGDSIDFTGNHLVGAEASALLQRYNPYFWGALVALCTIVVAYLAFLVVRGILARARLKTVDAGSVVRLTNELSAPALDVLLWAWQQPDEPLRVADLQLTRDELQAGRATRLQQARAQRSALERAHARRSAAGASDTDALPRR